MWHGTDHRHRIITQRDDDEPSVLVLQPVVVQPVVVQLIDEQLDPGAGRALGRAQECPADRGDEAVLHGDTEDSGDFGMPGGLDISYYGTWVSGDRACKPLFEPRPVDPSAFAFVGMHNTSVEFAEATESYATVADAKRVMAQNFAQAKGCHTFRMKDAAHGEVVRYTHSVTATRHGTIDLFLHHFNGSTAEWIYDFHMFEGRVDGEMVHIIWGSSGGKTDPSVPAFRQFQKVVGAYRAGHPRSTA